MRGFCRSGVVVAVVLAGTALPAVDARAEAAGNVREALQAPRVRAAASVQNHSLVASLFEMGFKPAELANVLSDGPSGGVDRALRPGELCSGAGAGRAAGGADFRDAQPASPRRSLGDCMQERDARRRAGDGWGALSAGDPLALNNDLRGFVAAIPAWEPVNEGRVSSGFGFRRHPISRRLGAHEGTDFVTSGDRTVRASGGGVVRFAARKGGFGKLVVVEHDHGFETRYAHLARFVVRPGQRVSAGQKLGVMGSTGYSTGVHLHFELRFRDRPLDAEKALKLVRNAPALLGE